jgi:ATP-binding cassette subfamily B protein
MNGEDAVKGEGEAGGGWIRRLAGYCWLERGPVLASLAGSVVATVALLAVPLLQRAVIDNVILPRHGAPIAPLATGLLVAALMSFIGVYLRRYYGGRVALDVQHRMRTDIFGALSRLDGARQDEIHTGQLVGRSISDLNMVQGLLSMLPITLGSLLLFVSSLAIMVILSPMLSLVAFAVAPLLWIITLRSRRKLFPATWDAQQQVGEVAGIVDEAIGGVRVVKGFGQEEQEQERLERASSTLFASRLRMVRLTARYNPALTAIPYLGLIGVVALGGWLAIRGSISLGTFLAFSAYLTQLSGPVRILTAMVTTGQEARASVVRVLEVVDSRPVITDAPDAIPLPADADGISFEDVDFGYVPSQPVLRDFSLHVNPGETVAVVGPSGSGKSTLSLLLPRFYETSGGTIRVGENDIRDVTMTSLRDAIGLVMEDSFLFSDSVRANIAYGRPDASTEEIYAAARAAEADEFIRALPDGYDTVVGEQGLTLSGGQRQRVALSRALITDPRLLILDDATSAVDPRVEQSIHETLRRVMHGRTTLLIAHRRSTLNLADRIAVLSGEGQLVDIGTRDELDERCPLFRMLISGPGDDAEGTDAGDLSPELWDPDRVPEGVASRIGSGTPALGGRAGVGGGIHGMIGSMPPSPELLEAVTALPPATEQPRVDLRQARADIPGFTLRKLLRPLAFGLAIGLLLDALDTLAGLAMPALVRGGIDRGVTAHATHIVLIMAVLGLGVTAADWFVNIGETMVVGRNGERLLFTLRVKIFAQLQRLGLDFYERELSGRIMTRMTTDVDALSTFLQTGVVTMVNAALTFFGVLGALLVINVRLGLYVLAIMPFLIVATVIFRAKSSKAYAEAREKVSVVNADLAENVAGLRVTQAYGREPENASRFEARSAAYRASRLRAQKYIALYFPFVQALSTLAGTIILIVSAGEVRSGALSAGALIAYLLYIDMVFSPVQQLSQVFDGYQQAMVGLRRIKDLLLLRTSTPPATAPLSVTGLSGEIELRNVRFAYGPDLEPAVDGVNLVVSPGETVALVGQTGAGKSTLVKLIARFYDVTSGAVLVDGLDIRQLDLAEYRHRLGVVPQEAYLFAGTIRDSIAYAHPDATPAEVEAAAKAVGAHDMIARLPGGYLHPVAERGRNLSAGQRQLIALARAQLADPDILLLDEATAALDLASEATVTAATRRLTSTRSTIVVAHRLTTAARADRIAVMSHGRLAELGTHEELLAAGGEYAGLWEAFVGEASVVG